MLPVHCHSCLHVICLCSTVAEGSTDQLLKFQLSSVKTKVSKTTFKNGCQYCVHPVYLYIYLYISIYIYIYIFKKERNVLRSFAQEQNVLAFFNVLCKRTLRSLHSLQKKNGKERCVL